MSVTGEGSKTSGNRGDAERRPVVYCLLPADLAEKLHEPLARHFAADPGVEVVVERRESDRRIAADRRRAKRKPPGGGDRRLVKGRAGRRAGERRAEQVPHGTAPELPRRARRYAERIAFVRRLEPSGLEREDRDTARVVARFQAGDREAFGELYRRYFARVYAYLKMALDDHHEAEDAAQEVFALLLTKIGAYEQREQPFRAWLFTVVRNHAVSQLRKLGKIEAMDPAELDLHREESEQSAEEAWALDWITDRDLQVLVERLPGAQRQVLLLRFAMDLSLNQTAAILGRTANDVAALQHRASEFLRERLTALGRAPKQPGGAKMKAWLPPAQVIRSRRSALD